MTGMTAVKAEEWRAAWATECNRRLDRQHQIDHRSYARQAVEQEPTIHEGLCSTQNGTRRTGIRPLRDQPRNQGAQ